MPNNAPLLEQITQNALLIDEGAADLFRASIEHVVTHERAESFLDTAVGMSSDEEDFWPTSESDWRSQYRPYVIKNGILQIPVMGVLLNRFPWQLGRWATGYTYIEKALARGLADANVKGFAYIHHSPGGEVAGNFELGDKLFAARKLKPARAFVSDASYSASFSLSSACGPISITRSGGVGSVGVVTAHVDYSEALKKEGIKITFIFAGKHKVDGNAYEKLPENVKVRIQERINRIYDVFSGAVSRNRGMDEGAVRATEALTYDAKDGIEIGFADRIGSLEEEMVLFSDEVALGDEQMADVKQEDHDKAVVAARTDGETSGKLAGQKEGAVAERTRINAIIASDEGKKRPKAAMAIAMKTSLSLEEATVALSDMPEEKAEAAAPKTGTKGQTHFDKAMGEGSGVEAATGEDDDDEVDSPEAASNAILADYANASGAKRKTKSH